MAVSFWRWSLRATGQPRAMLIRETLMILQATNRVALHFDHDASGHIIGTCVYDGDQSSHEIALRYHPLRLYSLNFSFAMAKPIRPPPDPHQRSLAN
jgi:hypothetical protein